MAFEDILYHEIARKEAYKGFSECFHLPHNDLGITLKSLERHLCTMESLSRPLVEELKREFRNHKGMDTLKIDFTKLFVGPYGFLAPPYGLEYLEGERKIMGESTIDALEKYRAAGMVPADDFKDAPDHITTEFEFMYFLIFKEIEMIVSETETLVLDYLFKQIEFLTLHIGRWAEPFSNKVRTYAKTEFYRNLAAAAGIFIKEDLEYLNGIEALSPNVSHGANVA